MELKRVVVTGIGAITPIGNNVNEYWDALVNGVSGAADITLFDAEKFKTKFGCEIKDYNGLDYFDRKEVRKHDRYAQFGIIAAALFLLYPQKTRFLIYLVFWMVILWLLPLVVSSPSELRTIEAKLCFGFSSCSKDGNPFITF